MSNEYKLPQYSTKLFTEIWETATAFLADYQSAGIPTTISTTNATTLYYLLYAKYGNNPIANRDINQFKYKVLSIIFEYGPTWEKRLAIQQSLRSLSEEDLIKGAKAIYNQALNPSTAPGTGTLEELDYINAQNTTNYKKSKMEAYAQLWELLNTDVTSAFVGKFKVCFKQFVRPEKPLIYVTVEDDSEDEGDE